MSYTVAITLPDLPGVDAAAWAEVDAAIDARGLVPPVFVDFLARVTRRYPCICDLADEQADLGVWSDGPLRHNPGHRATVLGLVPSRVDGVLPFLIEEANALGLLVFDRTTRTIHRP